uniref:hypothetical protein n=1 Tax=Stappia sp. TaxID=1870903 RepID=UPI003BAD4ADE
MSINTDEWRDLQPMQKAAASREPVRFGLKQMRSGLWRATVLVRLEVLEKLRLDHWRFAVRVGSGANRARLALVPDRDGAFELQEVGKVKGGGVYRLVLPPVRDWSEVDLKLTGVGHQVTDFQGSRKALFIDLPKPVWDRASAVQLAAARKG